MALCHQPLGRDDHRKRNAAQRAERDQRNVRSPLAGGALLAPSAFAGVHAPALAAGQIGFAPNRGAELFAPQADWLSLPEISMSSAVGTSTGVAKTLNRCADLRFPSPAANSSGAVGACAHLTPPAPDPDPYHPRL